MKKVKVGCIGLGQRGSMMVETIVSMCENAEVCAVCDLYEDRVQDSVNVVKKYTGVEPFATTNADEVINMEGIEAILIFTSWESHIDLAIAAMEHGKYVGVEVAGAYSLNDCYRLVEAHKRTQVQCMLLENCCYGDKELNVLNMVRKGMLGEIVHCSGGYHHELRSEIAGGIELRHYRLRNYLSRNCENYPTHELGPIAKVLNINRGNRLLSLCSMSSKARGMKAYIDKNADKYPHLVGKEFKQGDIVTTMITCADGSTIVLTLDTTLPRAYSRGFTVRGTEGAYFEDNDTVFLESENNPHESDKDIWGNGEKFRKEYAHPLCVKYSEKASEAGHGGADYMVLAAFFVAGQKNAVPPIDVYDMATWMCITALSEESILKGGAPVLIPDFTCGAWEMYEKKESELEFSLD